MHKMQQEIICTILFLNNEHLINKFYHVAIKVCCKPITFALMLSSLQKSLQSKLQKLIFIAQYCKK